MKLLKLFLTASLLFAATTASAQFVNGTSSKKKNSSSNVASAHRMDTDPYSRIWFGYSPFTLHEEVSKGEADDDVKLNGLSLGFLQGISLTKKCPLFLEMGLGIQYSFGKFEEGESDYGYSYTEEEKYWFVSMNLPLNLAYKFSFAKNKFAITPYVGLNFRVNLAGEFAESWTESTGFIGDYSGSETLDLFDDSEDKEGAMGKAAWNRFQMGFNVGANINYKALSLGVQYTTDFMPIFKYDSTTREHKARFGMTTISLGVLF